MNTTRLLIRFSDSSKGKNEAIKRINRLAIAAATKTNPAQSTKANASNLPLRTCQRAFVVESGISQIVLMESLRDAKTPVAAKSNTPMPISVTSVVLPELPSEMEDTAPCNKLAVSAPSTASSRPYSWLVWDRSLRNMLATDEAMKSMGARENRL